jgi:hypothetical protein
MNDHDAILLSKICNDCRKIQELYVEYKETLIRYKLNDMYNSKLETTIATLKLEISELVKMVNENQTDLINKKIEHYRPAFLEKFRDELDEIMKNFNIFNYDENSIAIRYKNDDELDAEKERIVSIERDQHALLATCGKHFEYNLETYNFYFSQIAEVMNTVYKEIYKYITTNTKKI